MKYAILILDENSNKDNVHAVTHFAYQHSTEGINHLSATAWQIPLPQEFAFLRDVTHTATTYKVAYKVGFSSDIEWTT